MERTLSEGALLEGTLTWKLQEAQMRRDANMAMASALEIQSNSGGRKATLGTVSTGHTRDTLGTISKGLAHATFGTEERRRGGDGLGSGRQELTPARAARHPTASRERPLRHRMWMGPELGLELELGWGPSKASCGYIRTLLEATLLTKKSLCLGKRPIFWRGKRIHF